MFLRLTLPPYRTRGAETPLACEPAPDFPVDLGGIPRSGISPRSDRPYRFVGDHHPAPAPRVEALQRRSQLSRDHPDGVSRLTLGEESRPRTAPA